jgi:serine/threonine-protein kinase
VEPIAFGKYELLEKIATGGMAEVFRARLRRPSGVSKVVCLKRIHPSLCADPSFVSMFIEEAKIGCVLSHGNIVPVFDFGCIDGYHFLAMDFLVGHDLADVIARSQIIARPFPRELALYIVGEVLEGLAYAHAKRDAAGRPLELVHRDISPSNIMISEAGEVKILDFGIARSKLRDFRTRTGVVKGKPGYMAPEQTLGASLDARVDIFACGVMLHELLTGRRPFQPQDADDGAAATATPSFADAPELVAVIDRATSPDPADRFAGASEMSRAITEVLDLENLRPVAADLARHVDSLFETPAPTRDWSQQAEAFDRRLAALADEVSGDSRTEPGDPTASPVTEPLGTPAGPRSPGRRRKLVGLIVLTIAVAGAAALVAERFWEQDQSRSGPAGNVATGPAATSEVQVRTRPAGASVAVDGRNVEGVTPLSLELEDGAHDIEIRRDGSSSVRRRVEARSGQIVVLDVTLAPVPGTLSITSDPGGAAVTLDGQERGHTPLDIDGIDRDRTYRIGLSLPDHETWNMEVSLDGAERRSLEVALVRTPVKTQPPGFLSVNAHPWAVVQLDGQRLGETPIVKRSVRAGRHVLLLSNPARGVEVRRVITVQPNEDARVSVDLTRPQ